MGRPRGQFSIFESDISLLMMMQRHHVTLLRRADDGESYAEMAMACGIPLGTVKSRLNRAREKLTALRAPSETQA